MSRRSLNNYQKRHPLITPIERWLHGKMKVVLGNSQAVVEQLEGEGIAAERLGLIYNGVDLRTFKSSASKSESRKSLDLPARSLVLVTVANLIPYKGHADLLAALGAICHALPKSWYALLVGRDDGVAASLRDQALRLGIDRNVRWLGERHDVPDILVAADIGVLPSHEEGFSNSVLEVMAMGLPAIVTDVGGNAEAVIHEQNGLLVPPRDPSRLGEAILTLSSEPKRRRAMGKSSSSPHTHPFPARDVGGAILAAV